MRRLCLGVAITTLVALGIAAPLAAASPAPSSAPSSWIALYTSPGAYDGTGSHVLFQPSAGLTISASGAEDGVSVSVIDAGIPRYFLAFAPINGMKLTRGDYVDAERAAFRSAGHPGIDIHGDGFGCNIDSGEFIVDDIAFDNGQVGRLSITFDQRCQGGTAQFGQLKYNEPDTGTLTVKASAILFPAQYVGVATPGMPLWVTNNSATTQPVGAVTTGGAGAADIVLTTDDCPSTLGPGATCTITVTITPHAVGVSHSTINIASGSISVTVPVTDAGIAGNAAFVLDSQPGDWVGGGQQTAWNQFDSKLYGGGNPASVAVNLDAGGHWFDATISAPAGQTLTVGQYDNAQRVPFQSAGRPGLEIYGDGRSCNTVTGRFSVLEIAFDSNGLLARFAADLEQQCDGGRPALFVSIRLGSMIGYSAVSVQPSPGLVSFAGRLPGSTSPPQPVTITNSGVQPLAISWTVVGPNAGDFSVGGPSCLGSIPPGASCAFAVVFDPQGSGARTASLVLRDDSPRGSRTVSLTGTGSNPPAFVSPTNGQVNVDTTKPFVWSTNPQAQSFYLVVGTTSGGAELVDSGVLPNSQWSYNVPALPSGVTIYATLFTQADGNWGRHQTITFSVMARVAAFTYPVMNSFTADPPQPFTWTTSSQALGYYLVVGTGPGRTDLINSGILPASQSTYAPPPLPANTTLYATVFTEWTGHWDHYQSITFRYQAAEATFTSPLNGQRVVDMRAPITWSRVPGAQAYYLVISTTPGGADLVNSGVLPAGRFYYPGISLPKGVPIFATIFSQINGSWAFHQAITYTAG